MNNYEIQRRLRKIRRAHVDAEYQHCHEDLLWSDVLRAVADGDYRIPYLDDDSDERMLEAELQHIRDLCRAALESLDIEFPRHCS